MPVETLDLCPQVVGKLRCQRVECMLARLRSWVGSMAKLESKLGRLEQQLGC